jgi:hypothetical protein
VRAVPAGESAIHKAIDAANVADQGEIVKRIRRHSDDTAETAFALSLVLALACLAGLMFAGSSHAANVSYVGSDGNVWVSSPDGAQKKQVTTNGTPASAYRSPSQKNDGTVAAIKTGGGSGFVNFFNPATGQQTDAWLLPKNGAGSFSPLFGGQVSPDGGMFAYDWRYFDCATNPCSSGQFVSFISGPGTTNPCLINCHRTWIKPRWVPGTPYAGMVDDEFRTIGVQRAGSAQPTNWLVAHNPSVEQIDSVDFGANGRTLVETSAPGPGPSNLVMFANNGTPPAGNPQALCAAVGFAGAGSDPRFSPDGSMISWTGAAGVYTSPAPTTDGGVCGLQPKLIAPGAKDASWGPANVPVPADTGKKKKKDADGKGGTAAKCKKAKKKKGKKGKKKKGCK